MASAHSFAHLLAPGRIGTLETRNRIVMAPMGSNLAEKDGYVGERITRYYEARARGGVGLIIVGVGAIAFPVGACIPNQVAISDDVFLPGLRDLTDRVHNHGAKIAIQLQHAGKVATQDISAGRPLWVPAVPSVAAGDLLNDLTPSEVQGVIGYMLQPGSRLAFHAMTTDDIRAVIERFATAADRARRAGFDGVEIHAAHGYLISAFLSPASNTRSDEYGGPLENRTRLLVETIRAVKQRVGAGFPVWCRLDAKEFHITNGITVEDAQRTAEIAVAAGADAIHVSAYADPTSGVAFTDAPLVHEPCGYVALAAAIKRRIDVPVIVVGRIEPDEADESVAAGKADFIAMARKLLADPQLPEKLRSGRPAAVRPCIYCYTCVGQIFLGQPTRCAVNPATGHEAEFEMTPAARPKQVLVVGGGPGGLEVARVAAVRGHRVTLCERSNRLGGALHFASLVYDANAALLDYLETRVRGLTVDIRLGKNVTFGDIEDIRPDVVVIAVGGRPVTPAIPGIDGPNVLGVERLHDLVSAGGGELAGRRVAVIGGGRMGIEIATFLSKRSREVSVLEAGKVLAVEMALPRRWRALHEARAHGVRLLTEVRVESISDAGVLFEQNGEHRTVAADLVVVAAGVEGNRGLAEALQGLGIDVHLVGDCTGRTGIEGALHDAARVGRAI